MKNRIKELLSKIKFPLQVCNGCVCDSEEKQLLKANRDFDSSPLAPHERDTLIELTCIVLNKEKEKGETIERLIEYAEKVIQYKGTKGETPVDYMNLEFQIKKYRTGFGV